MQKLTKRIVDAAQPALKDLWLWDNELRGFGIAGEAFRRQILSGAVSQCARIYPAIDYRKAWRCYTGRSQTASQATTCSCRER